MQLKRCSGAIWPKHLPAIFLDGDQDGEVEPIELYFDHMAIQLSENDKMLGGALALEVGEEHGNLHIQYYLEHKPMRLATIGRELGLKGGDAITRIKHSAKGAYDYCAGLGEYANKEGVLKRFVFGEVKCWGSGPDGRKADLNGCVEAIMNGNTPYDILKENPYAYAIHRQRIWGLYDDLKEMNSMSRFSDDVERAIDEAQQSWKRGE